MASQDYYQGGPPPQGQYGPPQGQYGPPQGQYPPPQQQMNYQQGPPPDAERGDGKNDKQRGCLAGCLATLCCCWLCGEACECFFDCLDCCC